MAEISSPKVRKYNGQPALPQESSRYTRSSPTSRTPVFSTRKHASRPNYNRVVYQDILPPGWVVYFHPDGKPYFHHLSRKIVTEADPQHYGDVLDEIYQRLKAEFERNQYVSSDRIELYLHLPFASTSNPTEIQSLDLVFNYYYVDHSSRDVFWLHDFHLGMPAHAKVNYDFFLDRTYYGHLENFPCHTRLPAKSHLLLHDALIYACTEHTTAADSAIAPFNASDAKLFLELLKSLEENFDEYGPRPGFDNSHRNWFIAHLLGKIFEARLIHRHGTLGAVNDRLQSVPPSSSGFLDFVLGAPTFFAHLTYTRRLERVWAAGIVSLSGWQNLLNSLLVEWSDSNLLATVTLSANMAFLALSDRTWQARLCSIVSTFLSIGSIATGLHHVWRHRDKRYWTTDQAVVYFQNAARPNGKLTLLSWIFSLPIIFLSWSLLAFSCAISLYTFQNMQHLVGYVVPAAVLGIVGVLMIFLVLFFLRIFKRRKRGRDDVLPSSLPV